MKKIEEISAHTVASVLVSFEAEYLSSTEPTMVVELPGVGMISYSALYKGVQHGALPPRKGGAVYTLPPSAEVRQALRSARDMAVAWTPVREQRAAIIQAAARLEKFLKGESAAVK